MTDEEVKDFVAINFSEYFKSTRKAKILEKVAKFFYIFLTKTDKVEKYVQSNSSDNSIHRFNVENLNTFDPELQLINTKPIIKNKWKGNLNELKKFKVETIIVLDYNNKKIIIIKSSIEVLN